MARTRVGSASRRGFRFRWIPWTFRLASKKKESQVRVGIKLWLNCVYCILCTWHNVDEEEEEDEEEDEEKEEGGEEEEEEEEEEEQHVKSF